MSYDVEAAVARLEEAWADNDRDCRPGARIRPFNYEDGVPDRSWEDYPGILYHHLRAWVGDISRRSTDATELRLLWEVERFEREESRHLLSLLADGPRVLDDAFFRDTAGASLVRAEDRAHVRYILVDAATPGGERRLAATMPPAGAELLRRPEEPEPDFVAWARKNVRLRRVERIREASLRVLCAPVLCMYLLVTAACRAVRKARRKAARAR